MNAQLPVATLSETLNLTTYRVANEPVRTYPFPHFYATDVFHPDIFRQIHACWPRPDVYPRAGGGPPPPLRLNRAA